MQKGLTLANLIVCRAELQADKISDSKIKEGYLQALDYVAKEIKQEYEKTRQQANL